MLKSSLRMLGNQRTKDSEWEGILRDLYPNIPYNAKHIIYSCPMTWPFSLCLKSLITKNSLSLRLKHSFLDSSNWFCKFFLMLTSCIQLPSFNPDFSCWGHIKQSENLLPMISFHIYQESYHDLSLSIFVSTSIG